MKFTLELIRHVEENYCIDTSRIYSTGKSNGGGFTGLLACDASATEKIAGFAAVSGAWYLDTTTQQLPPCTPSRKVIPFLEFHGEEDKTIKYHGGLNTRGNANSTDIPSYVNAWAERDGFDANKNETKELCGGSVKVFSWNGDGDDEEKATVQHYRYSDFGHDWMSEFGNEDAETTTCRQADATRVILTWIQSWTL